MRIVGHRRWLRATATACMCSDCLGASCHFLNWPSGAGRGKSVQRLRRDCTDIMQSQCICRTVSTATAQKFACASSCDVMTCTAYSSPVLPWGSDRPAAPESRPWGIPCWWACPGTTLSPSHMQLTPDLPRCTSCLLVVTTQKRRKRVLCL